MSAMFRDREEAGRLLARRLQHLADREKLVILGLPRGGVPVAFQVAKALGGQLDVLVVRKLGLPGQEELAMGAVASGGVRVINEEVVNAVGVPQETLELVAAREGRELERRQLLYRGDRPFPDLHGATVVLVDDGVATGSTMLAAVRALKQLAPAHLVVAAPVMSESAHALLAREADTCVSLSIPEPFYGVGTWYGDFSQTSDAEVIGLLAQAHGAGVPGAAAPNTGRAVAHAADF